MSQVHPVVNTGEAAGVAVPSPSIPTAEQAKPDDGAPTIAVGPQQDHPSYSGKPREHGRIDEGGVQAPGRLSGR